MLPKTMLKIDYQLKSSMLIKRIVWTNDFLSQINSGSWMLIEKENSTGVYSNAH